LVVARGTIPCAVVFREGAGNCARGGRAPFSISDFGINPLALFIRWQARPSPLDFGCGFELFAFSVVKKSVFIRG
jgi:hypothetical protein